MVRHVITFTEYVLPNGRKRPMQIERPVEITDLAESIQRKGYRFEIELLRTGHVSMTVENNSDEQPLAHKLVPNGSKVPETVDALVRTAAERLKLLPSKSV